MIACVLAVMVASAPVKPIFAGWIRSAEGKIAIKSTAGTATLDASKARGRRLYGTHQVRVIKGAATLLIFGKELKLKPASGLYTIPNDPQKAPKGSDVYAKHIVGAGRERDAGLAERIWLGLTLAELVNPKPPAGFRFQIRLIPSKPVYRSGEEVGIEVRNDSSIPLHFAIFDIDAEATVSPLVSGPNREPLPARSGWKRLPETFTVGLAKGWKEGTDTIKVVATKNPVDFASFDAENETRRDTEDNDSSDPLIYLMRTLFPAGYEPDPGPWITAQTKIVIRR